MSTINITKSEYIQKLDSIYFKHAKKLRPIIKYHCIPLIKEVVDETFIVTEVYLYDSSLHINEIDDDYTDDIVPLCYNKFITSPIVKSSYNMGKYEFNLNNTWDKYFMAIQNCVENAPITNEISKEMVYDILSSTNIFDVFGTMDYREYYVENMNKEEWFKNQISSMEIIFDHVYKAIVKANKDFEDKLSDSYNKYYHAYNIYGKCKTDNYGYEYDEPDYNTMKYIKNINNLLSLITFCDCDKEYHRLYYTNHNLYHHNPFYVEFTYFGEDNKDLKVKLNLGDEGMIEGPEYSEKYLVYKIPDFLNSNLFKTIKKYDKNGTITRFLTQSKSFIIKLSTLHDQFRHDKSDYNDHLYFYIKANIDGKYEYYVPTEGIKNYKDIDNIISTELIAGLVLNVIYSHFASVIRTTPTKEQKKVNFIIRNRDGAIGIWVYKNNNSRMKEIFKNGKLIKYNEEDEEYGIVDLDTNYYLVDIITYNNDPGLFKSLSNLYGEICKIYNPFSKSNIINTLDFYGPMSYLFHGFKKFNFRKWNYSTGEHYCITEIAFMYGTIYFDQKFFDIYLKNLSIYNIKALDNKYIKYIDIINLCKLIKRIANFTDNNNITNDSINGFKDVILRRLEYDPNDCKILENLPRMGIQVVDKILPIKSNNFKVKAIYKPKSPISSKEENIAASFEIEKYHSDKIDITLEACGKNFEHNCFGEYSRNITLDNGLEKISLLDYGCRKIKGADEEKIKKHAWITAMNYSLKELNMNNFEIKTKKEDDTKPKKVEDTKIPIENVDEYRDTSVFDRCNDELVEKERKSMERIIDKVVYVVTVTHVYDGYIKTEVSYFKTKEKAEKKYQKLLRKYTDSTEEYEEYKDKWEYENKYDCKIELDEKYLVYEDDAIDDEDDDDDEW